jgi:hypothetical protein
LVTIRDQDGQAVQEQVRRAGGARRGRGGAGGRGDLGQPGCLRQAAHERRGGQRVQVGLAGQLRIDLFESVSRGE